jgi:hypothetical protein
MKKSLLAIAVLAFTHTLPVSASEEPYQHHKGLPAGTLEVAVAHFSEYNLKLEKALAEKLDDAKIQDIHELTYTLENALEKMNKELANLAEALEVLHKASERIDPKAVSTHGQAYLDKARLFSK